MSTEINATDGVKPSEPTDPVSAIRALLDHPETKSDSWQEEAGRRVGQLAVAFLKEADPAVALRQAALVHLAQAMGVKEAKRREVKLLRWASTPPPRLAILERGDEQASIASAFSKVSVNWAGVYVRDALIDVATSREAVIELLRWGRDLSPSALDFVTDLYIPTLSMPQHVERLAAALKEAPRLLRPTGSDSAQQREAVALSTVSAVRLTLEAGADEEKTIAAAVSALGQAIQELATTCPPLLLKAGYATAIGRLRSLTVPSALGKSINAMAETFGLATVAMLEAAVEQGGAEEAKRWLPIRAAWEAGYPKFTEHLTAAAIRVPALSLLAAGSAANAAADLGAEPESAFARLLPAWDAFESGLTDPAAVKSLSMLIEQAARETGVLRLGEVGEVVIYDPATHELGVRDRFPAKVRVLRRGVYVQRDDGMRSVLLRAFVEEAD